MKGYTDRENTGNQEFKSRQGQEGFLFLNVQTNPEAQPPFYSMGTGRSFPGDKVAGS
jgi:hypothetical protein